MEQLQKAAKDGDGYCQRMCEDIQKNDQPANKPQGGVYHRMAGTYAVYIKAKKGARRQDQSNTGSLDQQLLRSLTPRPIMQHIKDGI